LVDTSLLFGGGKFAKTSQNVKALIVGIGSELVEIKPFFASKKFR
jgi:hypothetical protein